MTLRVRVNTRVLLLLLGLGAARSRVVCGLGSRVHLFRGVWYSGWELVWTQCAIGDRGWIESCMTGPDQANTGAARRAVGAEAGGAEGTTDADVALAWMLVLGDIYLRYVLYTVTTMRVARQAAGRRCLKLGSGRSG